MIATLYSTGQLNTPIGFTAALVLGFLFGLCLERAGFSSSRRLAAVFFLQDMTVIKVMFTAVVTAMLGVMGLERLGLLDISAAFYLMPTILGAYAVGGLLFGVGFAMAGWCPGTAATGLSSGSLDALVYLVGAVIGSVIFNEAYPALGWLTNLGDKGVSTLGYVLGLRKEYLVVGVTVGATLLFWVCEMVERGPTLSRPGVGGGFLLTFSAVLCLLSVLFINLPPVVTDAQVAAQAPQPRAANPASGGEPALLVTIETGADHMEPAELADRIMSGDPGLYVVDIRTKGEYDTYHLKGAVHAAPSALPQALESHKNQGVIVLYSGGMTHPAQARDALARLGFSNVSMLTGGLTGFFERCLMPVSLRTEPLTPDQAAKIKAWRKFFLPTGLPGPQATSQARELDPGCSPPCLVSSEWLGANLGKPGLKILDVSAQPTYNSGHIPGAYSLQLDSLRDNQGGLPSMLQPGAILALQVGQMGLTPRDTVALVYDRGPLDATLAAMALERLGHSRYVILQGGRKAWNAKGLPRDTALPQARSTRYPAPQGPDDFTVTGRQVLTASKDGRTIILDVRPHDYYTGAKSDEARAGHIPGALNRPFAEDQTKIDGDAVALKPLAELEAAYAALIPTKDHPVVVHCRTGHQASQTWWVLTRLLGYTNVKYYDAGWTEWAAHPDWPVATGPGPEPAK
ncbi:hypothetical protein JCM15519_17480 [Fundidesulfovibrio butyratiphilus]